MGDITKNFSRSEIKCPCCGLDNISKLLMNDLQSVRDEIDRPMTITSGVRCAAHNAKIGGVAASSHVPRDDGPGWAVDIACSASRDRYHLLSILCRFFNRIGMGATFVHVDIDPEKTGDVMWDYYKTDHVA